jgi:hypothetical protein
VADWGVRLTLMPRLRPGGPFNVDAQVLVTRTFDVGMVLVFVSVPGKHHLLVDLRRRERHKELVPMDLLQIE